MPRRRPRRRPWISTGAFAIAAALTVVSGWRGIGVDTADVGLATRVSDGERVYAFRLDRGLACFGQYNEPNDPGWAIEPFGWSVAFNGEPRTAPRWHRSPAWRWARSAYADPSGIVSHRKVPAWWALVPMLAWTAWRWARYRPLEPGQCLRCGYRASDLERCPECGDSRIRAPMSGVRA